MHACAHSGSFLSINPSALMQCAYSGNTTPAESLNPQSFGPYIPPCSGLSKFSHMRCLSFNPGSLRAVFSHPRSSGCIKYELIHPCLTRSSCFLRSSSCFLRSSSISSGVNSHPFCPRLPLHACAHSGFVLSTKPFALMHCAYSGRITPSSL